MLPEAVWQEIKAVFFDAEGTLVHIHPSVGHVYAKVWAEFGLKADPEAANRAFYEVYARRKDSWPPSPEGCFQGWREVFLETAARFGSLKDPEAAYLRCYECFARKEFFRLSPGAEELLYALKRAGLKLAVISNWDERLRRLLSDFGLLSLFDELFISCELGLKKPDPALYELACQRLKVSPSSALMVGDSLEDDVLGARRAGLWALRYPGGDLRLLFPGF